MHHTKLKTVFFGTPEFVLETLSAITKSEHVEAVLIVTNPSRPAGRGMKIIEPAVASFAKENNLFLHQSENINKDDKLFSLLEELNPDLFIVFAFSQFLSQKILEIPKIGSFNIHTSLLPKYRGSSPIHYALKNGDKTTGVSIQKMVKKMDAGDVCLTKVCNISDSDDYISLSQKLKHLSAEAVREFINLAFENNLTFTPQNESQISFSPLIKKSDGYINFKEQSAQSIYNSFRAYKLWPGIFSNFDGKKIKIIDCSIIEKKLSPSFIDYSKDYLTVGCLENSLKINQIQFPNKAPVYIRDFLNGHKGELPKHNEVIHENH